MSTGVLDYLAPHADRLRMLHRSVAADRFLVATGQRVRADSALYDTAPELTDGSLLRTALAHGDHARAGQLALWYFRTRLRTATDTLHAAQRDVTAPLDGRFLTHAQLLAAARTADDDAGRAAIRAALATVGQRLREARLQWLNAYGQARAELGYATHGELVRALHPDVDQWIARTTAWLEETRADFLTRWAGWRRSDGITDPRLRDVLAAGSPRLPGGELAAALGRDVLAAWGFTTETAAITADLEPRPGKVSFAFCTPVDPPRDVRLSAGPVRTAGDLVTLVHEYGHALHFTAVGDIDALWRLPAATVEALGFALEGVVLEPSWQQRFLGASWDDRTRERLAFRRDVLRRMVATALIYEMAVHDGNADPDAEYARLYGREFAVAVDRVDAYTRLQTYLEGQPCYPLVYVQAYAAAPGMWHYLNQVGGRAWWLGHTARPAALALFGRAAHTTLVDWARENRPVP